MQEKLDGKRNRNGGVKGCTIINREDAVLIEGDGMDNRGIGVA